MAMDMPYHYAFRVIVIGDTMVGKSSLLKTFSDGSFGEMEPTVGVDFFSKIIKINPKLEQTYDRQQKSSSNIHKSQERKSNTNHRNLKSPPNSASATSPRKNISDQDEEVIIKLQIWDTAGQERFRSIVTSYYRNSVGIILVYDVTNRESYDHLIDWFTEARQHVEPAPSPTLSPITQNSVSQNHFPFTSTPNASPNHRRQHQQVSNNNQSRYLLTYGRQGVATDTSTTLSCFESEINQKRARATCQDGTTGYKMTYLVLATKTDLEDQRQVSYEDGQAFADEHGFKFIETSSKKHHNIEKAFYMLAEEIHGKISECSRSNALHRTASGAHLTLNGTSQITEGIRIGPLISSYMYESGVSPPLNGQQLLEAQPVSGLMGGCC